MCVCKCVCVRARACGMVGGPGEGGGARGPQSPALRQSVISWCRRRRQPVSQ